MTLVILVHPQLARNKYVVQIYVVVSKATDTHATVFICSFLLNVFSFFFAFSLFIRRESSKLTL